jgi:hypothetical protein
MRNLILAALLCTGVPAIASAEVSLPKSLTTMSPEAFQKKTVVKDDPLEFNVTFSTEKAHRTGWTSLKNHTHDNYLTASLDRRTGAAKFEVRQDVRYIGQQRRDYRQVHYSAGAGLQQVDLGEVRQSTQTCPLAETYITECILGEHMAFTLDEKQVREIAARYRPGANESWAFKMKDATGHDITSAITAAEAAGLLLAIDDHRAGRFAGSKLAAR